MKARELLLECKIALNVSSDYALAAALKIPRARISDYMKGDRIPDEYACFRIAEALRRDPAEIIAEIRAESDEKHADYFRDFLSRRGIRELVVGALLLTSSDSYTPEAAAADFHFAHNDALRRKRSRALTASKTASGRFFYAHKGESGHHALAPDGGATPTGLRGCMAPGTTHETPPPYRAGGACLCSFMNSFGG